MASWTRLLLALVMLIPLALPSGARGEPSDLERAYQREFTYLKAEKAALTKRLAEARAQGERRAAASRVELETLEGRLIGLSRVSGRLESDLAALDRAAEGVSQGDDLIEGTLTTAAQALDLKDLDPEAPPAQRLETILGAAVAQLSTAGEVRVSDGAFFLTDGALTKGQIVQLGHIASYGVSEGGSGVLAPAGEGRLRLLNTEAAEAAKALAAGQRPLSLPIFIYESLAKRYEPRVEKRALDVVQSGGLIAWVIVGIGAVAALLVLWRLAILLGAAASARRVEKEIIPLLDAGDVQGALSRCAQEDGPFQRVLSRVMGHPDGDAEVLESVATEAILHEAPAIERFGSAISVLAAVSPLLGLLGTVTGIIATFDVITEFGTGDPKMLSGGISEALITTELGLIVAIPALIIGTLLSSQAESLLDQLERLALKAAGMGPTGGLPAAAAPTVPDASPQAPSFRIVQEGA